MEPFKNAISPGLVRLIGQHLARHVPGVSAGDFAARVLPELETLELKQRVSLVAEALHKVLHADPQARRRVLLAMLHPDNEGRAGQPSTDEGLCGWGIWPLTQVVGRYGLGSTGDALETLREMTKRGTAEFDVRPFIAADPDRALAIIASWVDDPNYHVRRLVSEGTRPRLPWGVRLQALVEDPSPMLPVLERLRDDPSDYVRRSVANHLNDIAKDHPDLVAKIAEDWAQGAGAERMKLIRHACRSLIKQGHPGALAVFGFAPPQIAPPVITLGVAEVTLGEGLDFDVELRSTGDKAQRLSLDYVVHHRKANGTTSPKVFKWTTLTLEPGERRRLSRSHPIRPVTTRVYYLGEHGLGLRINGADFGHEVFTLILPDVPT